MAVSLVAGLTDHQPAPGGESPIACHRAATVDCLHGDPRSEKPVAPLTLQSTSTRPTTGEVFQAGAACGGHQSPAGRRPGSVHGAVDSEFWVLAAV